MPCHRLKKTMEKIYLGTGYEARKKRQKNASDYVSTAVWHNFKVEVTTYALRVIKQQYDSKHQYQWIQVKNNKWMVLRNKLEINMED